MLNTKIAKIEQKIVKDAENPDITSEQKQHDYEILDKIQKHNEKVFNPQTVKTTY